jgi:hypothetical protein
MKQTAVDWLVHQVENFNCMKLGLIPSNIIEKAKEMEQEQIRMAFIEGKYDNKKYINSETYYQETYQEE